MIRFGNLSFDVKIQKIKNGVAKIKLVVKNHGDAATDGWGVGLGLGYEIGRSGRIDHSSSDEGTILSSESSRADIKAGRQKKFKFELKVGEDGISEADILNALFPLGGAEPAPEPLPGEQPDPAEDNAEPGEDAETDDQPEQSDDGSEGEGESEHPDEENGQGETDGTPNPGHDGTGGEAPAGQGDDGEDQSGENGDQPPSDGGTGEHPGSQSTFPHGIVAESLVKSAWGNGCIMEIRLCNTGNHPIKGWELAFAQPGAIVSAWRAEVTQSDDGIWKATSEDWNAELAPGQIVSFGFRIEVDPSQSGGVNEDIQFIEHSIENGQLVALTAPPVDDETGADPAQDDTGDQQPQDGDGTADGSGSNSDDSGGNGDGDNDGEATEPPPEPAADGGGAEEPNPENVIHVSSDITTAELQALVDSAPKGSVLQLESGTFYFTDTLKITRDDITIKGAGMGETILMGVDSGSANGRLIYVSGEDKQIVTTIKSDANKGDNTLKLYQNHPVSVGDKVFIQQANDAEYLDSIGSFEWRHSHSIRNTVAEVVGVNGDEITLRDPLGFDYDMGKAKVHLVDLVENVRMSDFTVTYDLGEPDMSINKNVLDDRYYRSEAITLRGTFEAELANIESLDSASTAFHFRRSLDLKADNLIANGAHNKGGGGNGYAFELEDVYSSEFSNLRDMDMRHGFTMGSWFSSGNNDVHIAFTNRDVNFHGGRDYNNTVIVDESVADQNNTGEVHTPASIKGSEGKWGAPTDPISNSITFTKVVTDKVKKTHDELYATDEGAYMATYSGHDSLHGGAGDDILYGGRHNDQLWGNGGSDTFVFDAEGGTWGSWTDVIHDFSVGEDRLELQDGLTVDKLTTADLGYGAGDRQDTEVRLSDGSKIVLVDAAINSEDDLFQ